MTTLVLLMLLVSGCTPVIAWFGSSISYGTLSPT
jgi:hypothetical protein